MIKCGQAQIKNERRIYMAKMKDFLEIPPVLTPEVIQAIAENAEALKAIQQILSSGDEAMALKGGQNSLDCGGCHDDDDCCCPKLIKFKIIGSTVIIVNKNAACEEEYDD